MGRAPYDLGILGRIDRGNNNPLEPTLFKAVCPAVRQIRPPLRPSAQGGAHCHSHGRRWKKPLWLFNDNIRLEGRAVGTIGNEVGKQPLQRLCVEPGFL